MPRGGRQLMRAKTLWFQKTWETYQGTRFMFHDTQPAPLRTNARWETQDQMLGQWNLWESKFATKTTGDTVVILLMRSYPVCLISWAKRVRDFNDFYMFFGERYNTLNFLISGLSGHSIRWIQRKREFSWRDGKTWERNVKRGLNNIQYFPHRLGKIWNSNAGTLFFPWRVGRSEIKRVKKMKKFF